MSPKVLISIGLRHMIPVRPLTCVRGNERHRFSFMFGVTLMQNKKGFTLIKVLGYDEIYINNASKYFN